MALAQRLNGAGGRLEGIRTELGEIQSDFAAISDDVRQLARAEAQLAVAEMKEQAAIAVRVLAVGAGATLFALLSVIFLAAAMHFGFDRFMPAWLAALCTAAVLLALAAVAGFIAKGYVRQISPMPKRTIRTIQEDVRWAKGLMSSSKK